MQDYNASFVNRSGVFPDTIAINASGPSTTDGTEFVSNMINDSMWGVWQMILNHASLTPNGVLESDSASQIKEALQKAFGSPPGTSQQWFLADDPGTTGHRALLLNGQGILRANFPDLDSAVYVGDGNNGAVASGGGFFYRADDAAGTTPNIAGVWLILPETRGYFPRGLDTAASVDPDGASRFLGDTQLDASQGHIHFGGIASNNTGAFVYGSDVTDIPGAATTHMDTSGGSVVTQPEVSDPKDDGSNGTPRTDTETRAINYSTKWVVWY